MTWLFAWTFWPHNETTPETHQIITDPKHIQEVQRIIDACDNDDESDAEVDDVEVLSSVCDRINNQANFPNKRKYQTF